MTIGSIFDKRAEALGACALLFGALGLGGCVASKAPAPLIAPPQTSRALDDTADFSVFLARRSIEKLEAAIPCSDTTGCQTPGYQEVLVPFEWIAGNSKVDRVTQEIILSGNPSGGGGLWLVRAERDPAGKWVAVETAPLRLAACLNWKAGERYDVLGLENTVWSQELSPDARQRCLERRLQ